MTQLVDPGSAAPALSVRPTRRRGVAAAAVATAAFGLAGAFAAISPAHVSAQEAPTALAPVTVGRTTVSWSPGAGFSLAIDGVPVVRQSTLYIVKEGWNGLLLDQRTATPVVSAWQDAPGGVKTATVRLENNDAACDYTFTVRPKDTVTVDLAYRMKRDVPAEIEYAAAYLSGPALQGATVTGSNGNQRFAPRPVSLAPPAPGRSQEENRLAPPFRVLNFSTRLGRFGISYEGAAGADPVIFDARSDDQSWAREFPVFWMGLGSPPQRFGLKDGVRRATFTYSIGEAPAASAAPSLAGSAGGRESRDAYKPVLSPFPLVIPRPKEMAASGTAFRFTDKTRLVVAANSAPEVKRAAALLQQEFKARFGRELQVITGSLPYATEQAARSLALIDLAASGDSVPPESIPAAPAKPEGYGLAVDDHRVLVTGNDAAGLFWGAQTLVQLLAADQNGALVRAVRISDWPSLSLRGVHLFHGREALPFHKKLIDRVFSRYKVNALFLQAEQVRWDHDPAVAPEWAGRKEQVAEEIAYARERGITVYPLIQSYGHMEWLFNKGDNRKFAEDPETPYAVNFTDPEAVKYLEGFNTEADELFGAPAFHIGLDEVTMRGRFPFRSAPKEFPELFVGAAKHWHSFFQERGKPVFMWADMALHPSEVKPDFGTAPSPEAAKKIREGLPKDIVMVNWQYGGRDSFPSLKLLKDAGFTKQVAATWFTPENLRGFSKAAAEVGAMGVLQTTWAGYESKESILDTEQRKQFEAMVLGAEYAWTGGEGPAPADLPYRAPEVFAAQWAGADAASNRVRAGVTYDLNRLGTAPLPNWLGYGPASGPQGLPVGKRARLADGAEYQIPSKALLLAGRLTGTAVAVPQTITASLPAGKPVQELRLLVAASHEAPRGTKLGTITVTRKDGKTESLDLVYGQNVAAMTDGAAMAAAPAVWSGRLATGQPASLRRLTWKPAGGGAAEVASVTITSANTGAAPAVFGMTALTD